jgi:hypothetical protein
MPNYEDPYDYNLGNIQQDIENKWNEQQEDNIRRRELSGVTNIGRGSWTSNINRFNNSKRDEYMKALESANNLKRGDEQMSLAQRQQAFSEASNYAQLARAEKERKENEAFRQQQAAEARRQFETSHEFNLRKLEEERERFEKQYGLSERQFDESTKHAARLLEEQRERFGKQHGLSERQFETSRDFNLKKLEEERERFGKQHGLARKQFKESVAQSARLLEEQREARKFREGMETEKFGYQKGRDIVSDKDRALLRNMQLRQAKLQRDLENRRITNEEYKARSQANLDMANAQIKSLYLQQEMQKSRRDIGKELGSDAARAALQGMIGQRGTTAKDMTAAGQMGQQQALNYYNSLSANQQKDLQQYLLPYFNNQEYQRKVRLIGEEAAKEEEMRAAAQKAAEQNALAQIVMGSLKTGAAALGAL